jgi:hypothetical protein
MRFYFLNDLFQVHDLSISSGHTPAKSDSHIPENSLHHADSPTDGRSTPVNDEWEPDWAKGIQTSEHTPEALKVYS